MRTAVLVLLFGGAILAHQTYRSGVEGVVIPVSVRNGNKPVTGLTAADFELRDNGISQSLQDVSAEKIPVDLTLLLDLSASVDGPTLQRLKTAVRDTAGLLRADDRIRLVAISQVLHEVFAFRPRAGELPLDDLSAEGATSLYDGLAATMMRPSDPGRRQLIVAFTDGRDSTSIVDGSVLKSIAQLSDAVVDIVVPTDSVPPVLTELVAPTSGMVLPLAPEDSVSRVFQAILDDFRATYVLQYVPHGVDVPGWHEVEITLKRRGRFEIRARKGYRGQGTIGPEERP